MRPALLAALVLSNVFGASGRPTDGDSGPALARLPVDAAADMDLARTLIAAADVDPARTLVHLADYVAADYPGAVRDGVVIDSLEFAEMVEFAASILSLAEVLEREGRLDADVGLVAAARALAEAVRQRNPPAEIAAAARAIRSTVLSEVGLRMAPVRWPSLAAGADLFAAHCVSCHGPTGGGDGPAAAGLDPRPAVLDAGERIASISPFQVFNTIRLGVAGTAMVGFLQLSDDEAWDLAFFARSLQAAAAGARAAELTADLRAAAPLEDVASMGDPALADSLASRGVDDPQAAVARIRLATSPSRGASSLDIAEEHLAAAEAAYRDGRFEEARGLSIAAYLEGVEPVEPVLAASDPALVARLEMAMMEVRSVVTRRSGDIGAPVAAARAVVLEARDLLAARPRTAWFTFGMALSILLREALEAFLIIIAMLGVIRASGYPQAARWIHAGWLAALAVGLAGWFLVDALIAMSAARRELLEGGISLLAVVVLLSVGFWLHDMTSVRRWKAFLDTRIRSELGRGSLLGLAAFAFFAVFREAFESVLFLAALGVDRTENTGFAIGAAALVSLAAIVILGVLAVRYSTRLPIRQLFRYASILVLVLAVVLVGKGIHALQEAGSLPASLSWFPWRIELLGIYPTLETLVAQGVVVGSAVALWIVSRRSQVRTA